MARTPAEISEAISGLFDNRARRFKFASRFVKAVFVTLAAGVAGIAQFLQIPDGQDPTVTQAIGIAATAVALLGSLFVLFTEEDASEELAEARRASEEAREALEELATLPEFEDIIERQIALYQSMQIMRGVIERAVVSDDTIADTSQSLLKLTNRILPVALGFSQGDRWTVCIYRAVATAGGGRDRLVCAAHNRAIMCSISEARSWEEGVGVSGIAYANRQEVIVPNMHAAGLGSVFNVASGGRDYDADRYRSMAVVPIKVDGRPKPWGVVVATNDRYDHFNLEEVPGLQNAEGVRAVAGMVALAVAVCKDDPVPATGSAEGATQPLSIQGGLTGGGQDGGRE